VHTKRWRRWGSSCTRHGMGHQRWVSS
jgi:hypothetical protein